MPTRRVLFTALTLVLLSAPAFAQDMKPSPSTKPASGATAPMAAPKPSTTGTATAPVGVKINLNSATEAELDRLPKIGPAGSKAIIDARAKAKLKNWDDFVARKVVPADQAAAIKDAVSF
jgi:DNA uptake protein ComE-like DNA-binding protein